MLFAFLKKENYVTSQVMDADTHDKYLVLPFSSCHFPSNMPFWRKEKEEKEKDKEESMEEERRGRGGEAEEKKGKKTQTLLCACFIGENKHK